MRIDFNQTDELHFPGMNGGTGEMTAKMYMDDGLKIIPCTIHAGGSIGTHSHPKSDDINYILSGTGKAICDGQEETLFPGTCHICKKGSGHSIMNSGTDDLVMLTIVVER